MSVIELAAPFSMSNARLKAGADQYEKAVSEISIVPTTTAAPFVSVAGSTPVPGSTTWVLTIAYAQDWKTPNSLSQWLADNAGTTKSLEFAPQGAVAGDPTFTVNAAIVPGPIGGPAATTAVGTVTMTCDKPVEGVVV